MKFFNSTILLLCIGFGLMLGVMDAWYDWVFRYKGDDPYLVFILSDFTFHEIWWRGTFLIGSILFGLILSYHYNKKKETEALLTNVFDSIVPTCITSNDYDIILANQSYYRIFGVPVKTEHGLKCYEHRPGPVCQTEDCPIQKISSRSTDSYTCESRKEEPGKPTRTFIVTATPYFDENGKQVGIIENFHDITVRRELEDERERLISKLNSALSEVKKLSGFLPICAKCKKVRDDKGYWQQVESYISQHSEAEFSHSICPDCAAKYYSKLSK